MLPNIHITSLGFANVSPPIRSPPRKKLGKQIHHLKLPEILCLKKPPSIFMGPSSHISCFEFLYFFFENLPKCAGFFWELHSSFSFMFRHKQPLPAFCSSFFLWKNGRHIFRHLCSHAPGNCGFPPIEVVSSEIFSLKKSKG